MQGEREEVLGLSSLLLELDVYETVLLELNESPWL